MSFRQLEAAHNCNQTELKKEAENMLTDFDAKIAFIAEKQTISNKDKELIAAFRERLLQSHIKSLYRSEQQYIVYIDARVKEHRIHELKCDADENGFIAFMMVLDDWQYAVDKVQEHLEELAQSLADEEQTRREEGD